MLQNIYMDGISAADDVAVAQIPGFHQAITVGFHGAAGEAGNDDISRLSLDVPGVLHAAPQRVIIGLTADARAPGVGVCGR